MSTPAQRECIQVGIGESFYFSQGPEESVIALSGMPFEDLLRCAPFLPDHGQLAVRNEGDAMRGRRIHIRDGDILMLDLSGSPTNDQPVVAVFKHRVVCRRLVYRHDSMLLRAEDADAGDDIELPLDAKVRLFPILRFTFKPQ